MSFRQRVPVYMPQILIHIKVPKGKTNHLRAVSPTEQFHFKPSFSTISQNQYTSTHHILLCTKMTHGCYQYSKLQCVHKILGVLGGYLLTIDWLCCKINTLQDIVIYYYVPKWYKAGIKSLDCTVFTRFFGYQLAISWLCPTISTLQDIVIYYYGPKWYMAAISTLGCRVCTRFVGYQLMIMWLLAGYAPKSIHFKTWSYITMYQCGTWLLSILQTAVCSGEFLAIGWLLAGYVPKSIHFKTYIILPKVHMAAINTLGCSVFTRFLAIGWLLAGYRLAIGWLCPTIITLQDIVIYYYVSKLNMDASNTLDCSGFTRYLDMQL